MKIIYITILLMYVLGACSPTLDEQFSYKKTDNQISSLKREIDSIDYELIIQHTLQLMWQQKDIEKMTYREILESAKSNKGSFTYKHLITTEDFLIF